MQPFDEVILDFMKEQDIPGASVALSRAGKLLYCQGKQKKRTFKLFKHNFVFPRIRHTPAGLENFEI